MKYSLHHGRIRVRVHGERGGALCAVQDEGPGLTADDQRRLFQPGVRLSAVPTGGEPTSGYGLAIAKRFAGCPPEVPPSSPFRHGLSSNGEGGMAPVRWFR